MKAKGKVKLQWTSGLAYAVGLLTTDGNLSPDGRHISFTSKDLELARKLQSGLGIAEHIGKKGNGANKLLKKYYVVQFSDKLFYQFLLQLGLMPNKTKKMRQLAIPDKYFFHFLRGHFDGDGSTYSYYDKRWPDSYMVYTTFCSASQPHILWLKHVIEQKLGITGHITKSQGNSCYQLKYAKTESLLLVAKLYKTKTVLYLTRKYLKIQRAFAILGKRI
ncbi:MAG: hypothetical protein ACD_43C00224G0006 [uncultured bacterium]|nr:MAG: hypothetical protein ACD_43C00224G0006 [uncultured bacterium]